MNRLALIGLVLVGVPALMMSPGAQAGGDPIVVCVKDDGGLRAPEFVVTPEIVLTPDNRPCQAGEEKKLFAEWEPEAKEPPEPGDEEKAALEKQVRELSQRVAALEKAKSEPARPDKTEALEVDLLSRKIDALATYVDTVAKSKAGRKGVASRVTAPFEVVGPGGTVILRVAEKVSSASGNGAHVTIGAGKSGNYALRVYKGGGPFVAGVGQSTVGSGLVVVMDESGQLAATMNGLDRRVAVYDGGTSVASMVAEERGGTIAVYNGATPIAYLTKSSAGDGGNVTVSLNSGFGVFSAGAAQDGAGEACVNRRTQAGTARPACLGLGLPSAGMGK